MALALPSVAVQSVVSALGPDHPGWAWGEANLWAGALTLLLVAAGLWRTRRCHSLVVSDSRESVSAP